MNNDERKYKNRKRCLECKHYGMNVCPLMCDADVFQIDNCILEDLRIKKIEENTAEWFMFTHNPVLFLKYLNFQRKDKLPNIGSKIVTLRSGFGGWSGMIRYIRDIDEKYITLTNMKEGGSQEYISSIKTWYNDFFEI
jgi:hypothetical protein